MKRSRVNIVMRENMLDFKHSVHNDETKQKDRSKSRRARSIYCRRKGSKERRTCSLGCESTCCTSVRQEFKTKIQVKRDKRQEFWSRKAGNHEGTRLRLY